MFKFLKLYLQFYSFLLKLKVHNFLRFMVNLPSIPSSPFHSDFDGTYRDSLKALCNSIRLLSFIKSLFPSDSPFPASLQAEFYKALYDYESERSVDPECFWSSVNDYLIPEFHSFVKCKFPDVFANYKGSPFRKQRFVFGQEFIDLMSVLHKPDRDYEIVQVTDFLSSLTILLKRDGKFSVVKKNKANCRKFKSIKQDVSQVSRRIR